MLCVGSRECCGGLNPQHSCRGAWASVAERLLARFRATASAQTRASQIAWRASSHVDMMWLPGQGPILQLCRPGTRLALTCPTSCPESLPQVRICSVDTPLLLHVMQLTSKLCLYAAHKTDFNLTSSVLGVRGCNCEPKLFFGKCKLRMLRCRVHQPSHHALCRKP